MIGFFAVSGLAEQIAAADRGRITVFRGSKVTQRPRLLSYVVPEARRVGRIDRSHLPAWMAIVGLMGVTSKSVRLPVQKVQHGLAVATDLWFWTGCSGNALYPYARALFWTEQVQAPCCAPRGAGTSAHQLARPRRR